MRKPSTPGGGNAAAISQRRRWRRSARTASRCSRRATLSASAGSCRGSRGRRRVAGEATCVARHVCLRMDIGMHERCLLLVSSSGTCELSATTTWRHCDADSPLPAAHNMLVGRSTPAAVVAAAASYNKLTTSHATDTSPRLAWIPGTPVDSVCIPVYTLF